jgi:hypothetical protein
MEVYDTDGDGIREIVAECGTRDGSDVISMEGCYRVRESYVYKWTGPVFNAGRIPWACHMSAIILR